MAIPGPSRVQNSLSPEPSAAGGKQLIIGDAKTGLSTGSRISSVGNMNNSTPKPPERSFTTEIHMPSVGQIPEALANAFASCSAEAQMLEAAVKSAITKDVQVFAGVGDQVSFLEILRKASLGQTKNIAIGISSQKNMKAIDACIGFYDCVKAQWHASGRLEPELNGVFKEAVERRNRIAHQLLAEVYHGQLAIADALVYLHESSRRLLELRILVVSADTLSSSMGSVAADGSSLPRFKATS